MYRKSRAYKVQTTKLSRFIREAPSREKKRVYGRVLKRATDRQERILSGGHPEKA